MKTAELQIAMTSPGCASYRLVVAGRVVWSNRVHDCREGHAGARQRLAAWALAHGVKVVERADIPIRRRVQVRG